ncbi:MAG: aspartyl/asparaginyl beta-hydroxylase domain-containing protein [Burkholderiales bacterium]|nr:aspartyl/asparaginyl beta-hydroxylase domain-containing protein [Burkholderiales bacterium]MDE1928053.1 aspartyl/asparaginyl beta-hydroxylase domain-containing protein [Burkholderiales bacterium]MDE2158773.1 aspartyl/asparaginyl beta-hydroxylase domain-containing protein [Burkholderiales bacterium]MDE2503606.1 aspartyl/asparaginyl beta-hydroxylase domain-containing protein [Burkholderiales bacterium]
MPYFKILVVAVFALSTAYVHYRGRVRLGFWRQLTDHSTFMAPLNCFVYLFSKVPARPYLEVSDFPELRPLAQHWQRIRAEALALSEQGAIKASERYDDAGFNSFFKTGWTRFYLSWYGAPHPSARALCPYTTGLLASIPSVKAAMFAALPPGGRLVTHRDPYAGSVRYHLGLVTPPGDDCYIEVDGQRHVWRDGEPVMFDETFLHHAENRGPSNRIVLFCDVERPLATGFARAVNRAVARFVVGAAASPNRAGDRTGGINRAFAYVQVVRLWGKKIKARNRTLYYALKWLLFGGLLALWLTS